MNTWEQIDSLKAKFKREFDEAEATIRERLSPRAASTLRIDDVFWTCTNDGKQYRARSAAELLAQLPLAPAQKTRLG